MFAIGRGRGGLDKKKEKTQEKFGENLCPTPGVTRNPDNSGGHHNMGPTTRSKAQAQAQGQQQQGAKRPNKDGDESGSRKQSCLMQMVRKLRKQGCDITLPAKFGQGRPGKNTNLVFWVRIRLGGQDYLGVLDTGATISIVAKKILPCGVLNNTMPTAAIVMGDGHVVHSCGDCEVNVPMASKSIAHRFYVIDTEAFDSVLGTYFFAEHPQILSLTLQAPYVLHVDHVDQRESLTLKQTQQASSYLRVCKKEPSTMMVGAKTEDYQLLGEVLDQGLKEFGYSREHLTVELFASRVATIQYV